MGNIKNARCFLDKLCVEPLSEYDERKPFSLHIIAQLHHLFGIEILLNVHHQ
jgi:hypothetical protein